MFNIIEAKLSKIMNPLAEALGKNRIIKALTAGMMSSMPITLGVVGFAILGNLPIDWWQTFLTSTGLLPHIQAVISATSSMLAIYLAFTIAYCYAVEMEAKGLTAGVLSVAAFIILMPQTIKTTGTKTVNGLLSTYLGSSGIFVAMIIALLVASLYCVLMKKNLKIKMPESVPTMVSDALSPTFVAMIIFFIIFMIRYIVGFTSEGNIFDLVTTYIGKPVMLLGSSPLSVLLVYTFMNLCWFFGIHPSAIQSVYLPVILGAQTANIEAFQSGMRGAALPYFAFQVMIFSVGIGGQGNTLGLAFSMLTAKSERYKAMNKLGLIPNLFNINEPFIFGVPIMLNPIFFIPMVFSSLVGGAIGFMYLKLGFVNGLNPTVSNLWVVPKFLAGFLSGGWGLMFMILFIMVAHTLLYYPFFKIADNRALAEEQKAEIK